MSREIQGTEIQLGLAVESQKASLSVKRRLACEQLSYFSQAHCCLSQCDLSHGYGKKHLWFIKWKFLEAKVLWLLMAQAFPGIRASFFLSGKLIFGYGVHQAAAYYYHGLITDKGNDPSSSVSAVCCFAAAEELLAESKKACLSFCLADPVSRLESPIFLLHGIGIQTLKKHLIQPRSIELNFLDRINHNLWFLLNHFAVAIWINQCTPIDVRISRKHGLHDSLCYLFQCQPKCAFKTLLFCGYSASGFLHSGVPWSIWIRRSRKLQRESLRCTDAS